MQKNSAADNKSEEHPILNSNRFSASVDSMMSFSYFNITCARFFQRTNTLLSISLILASIVACSTAVQKDGEPPLLGSSRKPHTLAGRIFLRATQKFIAPTALPELFQNTEVLLLGERHDNSAHHRFQATAIRTFAGNTEETSAVLMEMLDDSQNTILQRYANANVDDLIAALEPSNAGWHYGQYYRPIFIAAADTSSRLLSANMERQKLLQIMMHKAKAPADLLAIIERTALSAKETGAIAQEIEQSHCGMITSQQAMGMVQGQRLRDAVMARAVVSALNIVNRVVLIAGSGHARDDRGVPRYLKALGVNNILSIGMVETETALKTPQDYASRWPTKTFPFDIIVFTPPAQRPDPCAQWKSRKIKSGQTQPTPE